MPTETFFATLHQDHEQVRSLTANILVERDLGELRSLVDGLEALLRLHMHLEERVVFPCLLGKVDDVEARILIHGAIADHELIEHMRQLIQATEPEDEAYLGRLHALDRLLAHHFDEEEAKIYKVSRENLDFDDFSTLQDQMKDERARFESDEPKLETSGDPTAR